MCAESGRRASETCCRGASRRQRSAEQSRAESEERGGGLKRREREEESGEQGKNLVEYNLRGCRDVFSKKLPGRRIRMSECPRMEKGRGRGEEGERARVFVVSAGISSLEVCQKECDTAAQKHWFPLLTFLAISSGS
eukprot:1029369-Rhodomonas_salina.2